MTPEQLDLLQRAAPVVEAAGDDFARCLYGRLFELHPEARRLFPDHVRMSLVEEVVFLAGQAHDLPLFLARANALGARHHTFGVHACDYPALGEALVAAAASVLSPWTAEMEAAWRRFHCLLADAMCEGAARGLFTAPPVGS